MTQTLSPFFRQQFFDQNGIPLHGGKICFYVAGSTSEFKNTYQDFLGSTPNTNPVILNSSGVAKIYGIGLYDVWIYNSSNELIESILNVDFGGSSSSGTGTSIIVPNYDALRNLTKDYDLVYVLGRYTAFDGGEGWFQLDTNSTNADDDGIELIRLSSSHYTRVLGDYVDPRWYGVVYNSQIDQSTALLNSLSGGFTYNLPVLVTGRVYLGSKTTITQGTLNVSGSLIGLSSIELRFKNGSKFKGSKNCLGNNINPIFEQSVCEALYLSWFTNGTDNSRWSKLANSSIYNYKVYIDIDTTITSDITIPSNLSVDVMGGSKTTIASLVNISIPSFVYVGKGEVFHYKDIAYIGKVKLGDSYCYLEWFGGIAGTALNTDNSIAFKAGLAQGNIYLVSNAGTFYNVIAGTYTVSNSVSFLGNIPVDGSLESINNAQPSTIRLNNSIISTGSLSLNSVKVDGSGSISVTGDLILNNSQISNTIAVPTGLSTINDTLTIDPQYILVGASGKILESTDASNWVSETMALSAALNSSTSSGNTYVIVGNSGYIFSSTDGSNWTPRTSNTTNNIYKVKYLQGKFVAVGASGLVLTSTNGINWNIQTVGTNDLRGVSYSTLSSQWIVVGSNGTIYVSSDLITWNSRVIANVTGILYDVYSNDTETTIVGYNGGIYTTTDFSSFTSRYSGATTALITVKYYSDKKIWIAGSTNGVLISSIDGVNYSILNTSTNLVDAIYDQIEINGKYLFACGSGYLLSTFDFNTFTLTQPLSNSGNNLGIIGKTGKVIAVGAGGIIKQSSDLQTWTSQTSGTTSDLYIAKQINGVYYILGASGTYLTSYDGSTWTIRSVGASIAVYDLTMNADKSLWIAVGSNGNIYSTTNPIADTTVWTSRTSNITADLTKIIYSSSTWYVYGKAGTILKSTDGMSWTNLNTTSNTTSNGIVSNGSLITVYFGNSGFIRSTIDGTTYVTRTTNTTSNLLSGVFANGKFVIVGTNGTILTSTDGITWTSQTSGTSAQLNRVAYLNSKFFIVGSSGTIRQSTDAITWSTAVSVFHNTVGDTVTITAGFKGIGYVTGYYYTFGEVGCKICYSSDLSTWIQYDPENDLSGRASPITVTLNDCYSQLKTGIIFGDGGYIYTFYADGMDQSTAIPVDNQNNWKRVVGNLVIGDNGKMASIKVDTTVPFAAPFVNPLVIDTTDNLIDGTMYGTNYTIISSTNTFTSPNMVVWTKKASTITQDIISVWQVDSTYYLISGGKLYSTTDNISFTYIKDTLATNIEFISGKYYLTGFDSSAIEVATTPTKTGFTTTVINSDPYVIKQIGLIQLNGILSYYYQSTSSILIGSVSGIALNVSGLANISDSKVDINVNNNSAGIVSNSTLENIAQVGKCENTTITNFSGTLNDDVLRSYMFTRSTIGITNNVSISECSIEEITPDTQLFDVADTVTAITLNNCNTVLTSMLCYSINTALSLVINNGFLTAAYSISNGYAKVYLNNVFDENGNKVNKTSAYSNDGQIFTPYALAGNLDIVTTDGWHYPQMNNLNNGTNALSIIADTPISSDINSAFTLRYRNVTYLPYGKYQTSGITYMGIIDPSDLYVLLPQPSSHMGQYYNCKNDGTVHWNQNGGSNTADLAVHKGDLLIASGPKTDSNHQDISVYELMTNTSPMRNLLLQGGKIVLTLTLPAGYDKDAQKKIKLYPQLHMPNYVTYHQYDIRHTGRFEQLWEDKRGNFESSPCDIDGATVITTAYVSYPWTEKTIDPPANADRNDDGNYYWDIFGDEIKSFPVSNVHSQNVLVSPIMGVSDEFTDYAGYITILSETPCVIPAGSTLKVTIVPCANKQYTDPWMQYWQYRVGNTTYLKGP